MEYLLASSVLGLGYYLNKDGIKRNYDIGYIKENFNKTDHSEKKLPIEYNNGNLVNEQPVVMSQSQSQSQPISTNAGYSLTGEPIDPTNFTHNNMQPFFGSTVKQNVDEYATRTIMDTYTGNDSNYKDKTEIAYMFDPQANVGNPYGMSNLSGYMDERYIVSNMRNNETPTRKIYVGPGLNDGYTWKPSGGFNQSNTRDYILPKNVDELRVKSNPKMTYSGRIVAGKRISRTAKIGVIEKHHPDSFYVNTPDRYFTAVGECVGPTQRAEQILKEENRETTEQDSRIGHAKASFNGDTHRSVIRNSNRQQLYNQGMRNVDGQGTWSVISFSGKNSGLHDYGKGRLKLRPNNRQDTEPCNRLGNVGKNKDVGRAPIDPNLRLTKKACFEKNTKWASNVQSYFKQNTVHNPYDIAKTTIKETLIDKTRDGNMAPARPSNAPVYNPDDIPNVTMKQTLINKTRTGNFGAGRPSNIQVYNMDDIARTTTKETTLSESHGFVGRQHTGGGYLSTNNNKLPGTTRQVTSVEYKGNVKGENSGAYNVTNVTAPNTTRQFTSTEYTGNAGGGIVVKPISYDDVYNSTIRSLREEISQGRTPSQMGPKQIKNTKMVNMTTTKKGNLKKHVRKPIITNVTNVIPTKDICENTKSKTTLENQNRLDPCILDALKDNPYAQSLTNATYR